MNIEKQQILSFFGSQALMLYFASNENLIGAVAVPLTIYGVKKGAKFLKLDHIGSLADTSLLGSFTATPGVLIGRSISAFTSGQFLGTAFSFATGSVISLKTFSYIARAK